MHPRADGAYDFSEASCAAAVRARSRLDASGKTGLYQVSEAPRLRARLCNAFDSPHKVLVAVRPRITRIEPLGQALQPHMLNKAGSGWVLLRVVHKPVAGAVLRTIAVGLRFGFHEAKVADGPLSRVQLHGAATRACAQGSPLLPRPTQSLRSPLTGKLARHAVPRC